MPAEAETIPTIETIENKIKKYIYRRQPKRKLTNNRNNRKKKNIYIYIEDSRTSRSGSLPTTETIQINSIREGMEICPYYSCI